MGKLTIGGQQLRFWSTSITDSTQVSADKDTRGREPNVERHQACSYISHLNTQKTSANPASRHRGKRIEYTLLEFNFTIDLK